VSAEGDVRHTVAPLSSAEVAEIIHVRKHFLYSIFRFVDPNADPDQMLDLSLDMRPK
jgi:hypothetical protein